MIPPGVYGEINQNTIAFLVNFFQPLLVGLLKLCNAVGPNVTRGGAGRQWESKLPVVRRMAYDRWKSVSSPPLEVKYGY